MTGDKTRKRKRLRGVLSGKSGKTIGTASIVTPIVGLIVNDLRKPDSLIRRLIGNAAAKLLEKRPSRDKLADITDKVEVIEDKRGTED